MFYRLHETLLLLLALALTGNAHAGQGCEGPYAQLAAAYEEPPSLKGEVEVVVLGRRITVDVVESNPEGSILNRIAHDLEKRFQTKVAIVPPHLSLNGMYYQPGKVILISERSPALLAHEARHRFFAEATSRGEANVFSGGAEQNFEEFFTHALNVRINRGEARLKSAIKLRDSILNVTVPGLREPLPFPTLPAKFFLKDPPFQVSLLKDPARPETLAIVNSARSSIAMGVGVAEQEGKKWLMVQIRAPGSPPLVLRFAAKDADGFYRALTGNLREKKIPLPKGAWDQLLQTVETRISKLEKLRQDGLVLNDKVIRDLEAGKDGQEAASDLINLMRRAALEKEAPLELR